MRKHHHKTSYFVYRKCYCPEVAFLTSRMEIKSGIWGSFSIKFKMKSFIHESRNKIRDLRKKIENHLIFEQ